MGVDWQQFWLEVAIRLREQKAPMTRNQRKQMFPFQAGGARHVPLSCN